MSMSVYVLVAFELSLSLQKQQWVDSGGAFDATLFQLSHSQWGQIISERAILFFCIIYNILIMHSM